MNEIVKQNQKAGDNSLNIQINGLSLSETQQLVKQEVEYQVNTILKDNFIKLQNDALSCANTRANELTQMFFDKLLQLPQKIIPQVLERLKDPDMQMSIFQAQKGYIKSGSKDKLKQISSLLKDKIVEKKDTLKSYLLDDALDIIPKLKKTHIDFLTAIMYLSTTSSMVVDWISFKHIVLDKIIDLCEEIEINDNDILYLSQLKCLENNALTTRSDLYKLLKTKYQGLFSSGLEASELNMNLLNKIKPTILMNCFNDPKKFQINTLNIQTLEKQITKYDLTKEEKEEIKQYFNKTLPESKIKEKIMETVPTIDKTNTWLEKYSHIFLTPLGMLIAISNYKEQFKEDINWDF